MRVPSRIDACHGCRRYFEFYWPFHSAFPFVSRKTAGMFTNFVWYRSLYTCVPTARAGALLREVCLRLVSSLQSSILCLWDLDGKPLNYSILSFVVQFLVYTLDSLYSLCCTFMNESLLDCDNIHCNFHKSSLLQYMALEGFNLVACMKEENQNQIH
jgi:hypothetical protein